MRQHRALHGEAMSGEAVFPPLSRANFVASYPEGPHKLRHNLSAHPLLELAALAELAEALPAASVDHHGGNKPIGETIRDIEAAKSWAVLRNIGQHPAYAALLEALLAELAEEIVRKTGPMARTQGSILVSSPNALTPYHFDPEHIVLLQLAGRKAVTVFPAGDALFAPDEAHEACHTGGGRELAWRDELACHGQTFPVGDGEAVYVPVMAPHHIRIGTKPSVSLAITWRSEWSLAEADARAFNSLLRRWGFDPQPPRRWPARNTGKAIAWRLLQAFPGIR